MLFKNNVSALSIVIIVWLLWTVFLPKTVGNFTESISPLPTRFDLNKDMKEDRSKGIDGHNPSDQRRSNLEKETLEKYGKESLDELRDTSKMDKTVNFSGIVLQADEEYGNKVWDKHFGEVYSILKRQKENYQISGLINPFASIQSLSMGSCGTDLIHHLDFLNQAEVYRRYFVKSLNHEYTFVSLIGDNARMSNNEFFRSIKGIYFNSSVLYNSDGSDQNTSSDNLFGSFLNGISAKSLMPSKITYFSQISGNFTPAITSSFSTFYMKGEEMLLIMPSITYEIKANLDSMLLGQFIYNNINRKINPMGIGIFARLSYNF